MDAGELFGQSFDAVYRRPRAVLVPLLVDVGVLALGAVLFVAVADASIQFPQGYRLPNLPVAVPHALPTVGDVLGPTPALHVDRNVAIAATTLIISIIPLLAFAEAGFLGVLQAVYLRPHDPIKEGRHADAWSRIGESFVTAGKKHFGTFLVLRSIQAALALSALVLPLFIPGLSNYGLGVLAVDFLLIYAPYAAIETGRGSLAAIRESLQLVSDHLATTLVAILFGFLLTGGIAILVAPLAAPLGSWGAIVAAIIYAPIGTVLSLYLYKVYLGFRPAEPLPGAAPAPLTLPASS